MGEGACTRSLAYVRGMFARSERFTGWCIPFWGLACKCGPSERLCVILLARFVIRRTCARSFDMACLMCRVLSALREADELACFWGTPGAAWHALVCVCVALEVPVRMYVRAGVSVRDLRFSRACPSWASFWRFRCGRCPIDPARGVCAVPVNLVGWRCGRSS